MLTPEQIAQKWAQNSAAAGPAIRAGVQAMREEDNPMAKAAARESHWAERCQDAARNNRFSRGCAAVRFSDWQRAMIDKGIPNHANGIAMGTPKMARFLQQFIPHIQRGVAQLQPRGTPAMNKARMNSMFDHLSTFRFDRVAQFGFAGPVRQ